MPELPVEKKSSTKYSVVRCRSWQHFKSATLQALYEDRAFQRDLFLFRGHGSSDWPLKSSFDRWFTGTKARKAAVSEQLVTLFQQEAEGIEIERGIWEDRKRRLALAQHHGLPTRLLDWTESPYVAAFFAFAGMAKADLRPDPSNPDPHVGIWCLDQREENIWSQGAGVEIMHIPSYSNERLRNQLGWFTLLSAPYDTLEEYIDHRNFDPAEASRALRQFQIPASEARKALSDLEMMGINYSRIYPGLEGCTKTAQLRSRWENS